MANGFETFLSKTGKDLLKVITFGAVVVKDAAPFVALGDPALGSLLSGSADAILTAQAAGEAAVAAAPDTDNGEQKAALAITAITPLALSFAKAKGLPAPTAAQIKVFNDSLVAALNAFEAPTTVSVIVAK